ncbi:hypothetical protein NMG29_22395 [Streptomyces cocklensis]|uniref:Lipoprotein n=1 Tax=Actinacidiphila cocklensis TaxID=887465 RepID=A0A9W4GNQ1_9ACTN|nr:hypothetical protein [Actinacidiphila cocklensis]MDD1060932.1 hypothetical protein [Actinacidiphila cocklensis]CAG6391573.1 conserved exported hypothetical protein [Actinacidiphila cocklensis]
MTTIRTGPAVRLGILPLALLAVLAAGCGTRTTQDGADGAGANRPSASAPAKPADFPCPGESTTPPPPPTTAPTSGPAVPPTDHYAENHGFMVPFTLHGKSRCDGLAAVARVKSALGPLSRRGDLDPGSTYAALSDLGYTKIDTYPLGTYGVAFDAEVDSSPLCVEGTVSQDTLAADAFGGYPDHIGCDRPTGGH